MPTHFETDVLIVGGGPAGAATALSLLTYSGLRVAIVEKSDLAGIRVGEQVSPGLFDLLAYLKIDKNQFDANSFVRGYSSLAAWGSSTITTRDSIFSPQEESYQLDREKFDLLLLRVAAERGAIVLPRSRCVQVNKGDNEKWQVEVKHQTKGTIAIQTTFLIDATGRQSSLCRQIGLQPIFHDQLVAVGTFLQVDNGQALKQDSLIETVEEGWWYCATLPNRQVVATLFTDAAIAKEKQLQKADHWNALVGQTQHVKDKLKHAVSAENPWIRNAFSKYIDFTTQTNFMAVGDAVASFDPISSMGIGFALSSACHAALSIMAFSQENPAAHLAYQQNISTIYQNYLQVKGQFYRKEKRWPDAAFWHKRS